MTFNFRTPNADSLALQTVAYRAMGHEGQTEDDPLVEIPESLLKHDDVDDYEPDYAEQDALADYTDAERLIGREICQETRKYDLREMKRAYNARSEK